MHAAWYPGADGQPFSQAGRLKTGLGGTCPRFQVFLQQVPVFGIGEIFVGGHTTGFDDAAADFLSQTFDFVGQRSHQDFVGMGSERIGKP